MDDEREEALRLEELRRIKRQTLHELDKQAAQYTAALVPPHIQTERQRLRRELGMVESVIASPLSSEIGTDLGEGGRFVAYVELMRQGDKATLEAVARLEEQIVAFIRDRFEPSERNSMLWRRWGAIALIIIVIVVVTMALIGVYQLGKFAGDQSFIQDVLVWR